MDSFIDELQHALKKELPGALAHIKMSPAGRGNTEEFLQTLLSPARISAVMILLFEDAGIWKTVLIKRPDYKGVHSGQISFPGGKFEEHDKDYTTTALRETVEEIGITAGEVEVIGALSRIYIPPSNFLVYPFIGICSVPPVFKVDPKEVETVIVVPIDILLDESITSEGVFMAGGQSGWQVKAPYFSIEDHQVWGATAAILSEFKDILLMIKAG